MTTPSISIINKSELEEGRLDAEFYQAVFLQNKQSVDLSENDSLGNLTKKIVVGYVSSMVSQYTDEGVDLLQTRNVAEFFLKTDEVIKINHEFHDKLKKSQVKKEDILVARSGSFGNASIYLENKIVNSSDIIIVEADKDKINPYYLTAFLNSQKGKLQLYRFASGGLQGHINTTILHNLRITKGSEKIEKAIELIINKSYIEKALSEDGLLYTKQLLLDKLNLNSITSIKTNSSTRKLSDYFKSNRLDSEYWLPKYDEIENKIKSYSEGFTQIGKVFSQVKSNFKPIKDTIYKYVEIGDINVNQPDYSYTELSKEDLPANAKISIQQKSLVTSKVRPNRGATMIMDINNEHIVSGAFVVLQEKANFNIETLYAYLKLDPIKELLLRYNTGSSYPTITDNDVIRLPIPRIDTNTQVAVKDAVLKSINHLTKSKKMLEIAKIAVEIYVEKGEKEALIYIHQNYEQI